MLRLTFGAIQAHSKSHSGYDNAEVTGGVPEGFQDGVFHLNNIIKQHNTVYNNN